MLRVLSMMAAMMLAVAASSYCSGADHDLRLPSKLPYWAAYGSTVLTAETTGETSKVILTSHKAPMGVKQIGAVWNQLPFEYATWELVIRFSVVGKGEDGGEGMALWLTTSPNQLGPIFGGPDMFTGMAIIFDSADHDNKRNNPSISAHIFDGTKAYSLGDDGIKTQLAGCIADYRNRDNQVAARIAFNSTHLSLFVDLSGNGQFRKCFVVPTNTYSMAFSSVYLGVSAETLAGSLTQTHQETHMLHAIELTTCTMKAKEKIVPPVVEVVPSAPEVGTDKRYKVSPKIASSKTSRVPPPKKGASIEWHVKGVHEKLDHLLSQQSHAVLEKADAGAVLQEMETNLATLIGNLGDALDIRLDDVQDRMIKLQEKAPVVMAAAAPPSGDLAEVKETLVAIMTELKKSSAMQARYQDDMYRRTRQDSVAEGKKRWSSSTISIALVLVQSCVIAYLLKRSAKRDIPGAYGMPDRKYC